MSKAEAATMPWVAQTQSAGEISIVVAGQNCRLAANFSGFIRYQR